MSSIVRTEIVPVAELSRMPYVVGPLALMPNLILAGVHQPPSHVVGSANVSEIVHVLVGAANVDQVFPQRAHAGTVVAGVDRIRLVPLDLPVYCPPRYFFLRGDFLERRIVKGIVFLRSVPHLIHM